MNGCDLCHKDKIRNGDNGTRPTVFRDVTSMVFGDARHSIYDHIYVQFTASASKKVHKDDSPHVHAGCRKLPQYVYVRSSEYA